jgi:choline dehydrogenase-like flavoprotein
MKVIGLERGPRLTTQDFNAHDELRYFQRLDLRPNPKRQPVTWRPNTNSRATPLPRQDYGNQAGGGTVHYGSVSWRLHGDDFRARAQTNRAIWRVRDPSGLLACRLALKLC